MGNITGSWLELELIKGKRPEERDLTSRVSIALKVLKSSIASLSEARPRRKNESTDNDQARHYKRGLYETNLSWLFKNIIFWFVLSFTASLSDVSPLLM